MHDAGSHRSFGFATASSAGFSLWLAFTTCLRFTQQRKGAFTMSNTRPGKNGLSYADAGVSIDAGNSFVERIKPAVRSTRRRGADGEIGGFGGLFDLKACGFRDPVLVAANDGVGTKLKIAIDTGIHDTIGIDLVAMCVNDLVVQGAEPLFFLDYYATGKLDIEAGVSIVAGIAEGCRQAGAALIGGETAEMPGLYREGDYDLAGFAVGAVERDAILPRRDIGPGDVLLGLASSGVHSNGFSLVRRVVELSGIAFDALAPFDPAQSLGRALLTPTMIYVQPLLALLRSEAGAAVKGFAHITGGGFIDNIPRVLPKNVDAALDLSSHALPPVFRWLMRTGGIDGLEMLRTFNCGIGMVIVAAADKAGEVSAFLHEKSVATVTLGTLTQGEGEPKVIIDQQPSW